MRHFTRLSAICMTVALMFGAAVGECAAASASLANSEAVYECSNSDSIQNHQQGGTSGTLNVYVVENEIRLTDVPDGATLHIYAITGARVGSYTVHENRVIMDKSLAKGIYIVRVNNRAAKITIR